MWGIYLSEYLERHPAATKSLWAIRKNTRRPIRLKGYTVILDATACSPSWYGEGHSLLDVTVFNRYLCSPWVRLLVWRTWCRTFKMAPCGTPVILDIYRWESSRHKNRTIVSIITGRIWVARLPLWFKLEFAYNDGSTQMRDTAVGTIGEIGTPGKRLAGTGQKW